MPTTTLRERPPRASPSLRLAPRNTIIRSGREGRHAGVSPKIAAAKRRGRAVESVVAAGTTQHDHQVRPGSAPRGCKSKDRGGQEARQRGEDQHGRIDANGIEPRKGCGRDGEQLVYSGPGDRETTYGADGCQQK